MYLHDLVQSGVAPRATLRPPLYLEWSFQTRGSLRASPIVVADTVFIASTDRTLYALPAGEWGERWRFTADAPLDLTPVYADGVLACVDRKANLYGLIAQTGERLWKTRLPGWTTAPPVYAGGLLWVGVHPNRIVRYDPRTGRKVGETLHQARIGDVLYVSRRGSLAPMQPATLRAPGGEDLPYAEAPPVRANGFNYVAYTDGSLRAFDASGEVVWEERLPAPLRAAPAIAGSRLYVPCTDGVLYVFGAGEKPPSRTSPGPRLTIVAWESSVRPTPNSEEILLPLNQGTELPLLGEEDGWAQVQLPSGQQGWIPPGEWAVLEAAGKKWPFRENRRLLRAERKLVLPPGAEYPLWSPDGVQVAFYRRLRLSGRFWSAQELWVLDSTTGEARRLIQGGFYNPRLSWSLDGAWLGVEVLEESEFTVQIVNAQTSERLLLTLGMAPSWSPRAHRLAYFRATEEGEELWRINGNGTEPLRIAEFLLRGYVQGEFRPRLAPAWHPRAQYLAVAGEGRFYPDHSARLLVVPVAPEATPRPFQTPAEQFHWLQWSPDGTKIGAILSGHVGGSASDPLDRRVYVFWLDRSRTPISARRVVAATWVDAQQLAYVDRAWEESALQRLWLWDVVRDQRRLLAVTQAPVAGLQWTPKSSQLTVWTTTPYVRGGKLQAAETIGWLFRLSLPDKSF